MVFHRLYGLLLGTNDALPGLLVVANADVIPDVQIHLKSEASPLLAFGSPPEPFYMSAMKDEKGNPLLRVGSLNGGKHLALLYCDGTRFAVESDGNEVFADWPDSLTLEDIAPYLVGPVLGLVLRLRGAVPLHASAVAIGDHAVAIAGPAGAGKSTTAAAFATRGCRVISDDVVALQEEGSRFLVPPGYPRVNLWTESVRAICGEDGTLPLVSPGWDKYFMPLDLNSQFEMRSLPLGGVYVLQTEQAGLTGPIIEQLKGTEAFVALLRNTYMNYLPAIEERRREFELLGRLVVHVPIRRIRAPLNLSMLPELAARIAADVEGLPISGPSRISRPLLRAESI
jgi:hypothetical protein